MNLGIGILFKVIFFLLSLPSSVNIFFTFYYFYSFYLYFSTDLKMRARKVRTRDKGSEMTA